MAGTAPLPRVVVVGGGFGGLYAARGLAGAPVEVTLLDRKNHHLFQPLLYQVAAAELSPADIAAPIRWVLRRQRNATVILAEARGFDLESKRVRLADGEIPFDFLVVSAGVRHSYFGHGDWERLAPGLKTVEDALEIRRRVLTAFEEAERETDPLRQRDWLTFAVVGGGPTGVEMAGALADLARHTLAHDFRRIRADRARVVLLEGLPYVLAAYPGTLRENAIEQLRGLGVEVRCGVHVDSIDETGLSFGGERLEARTVLWAAGVEASPLGRALGAPLDKSGRVRVTPELALPGRSDVFVIGDLAAVESGGKPVPGVAPAAIQMGRHTARNLRRAIAGAPLLPFRYRDKGMLATIGRSAAVADLGFARFSGWTAWVAWLGLHIFFLIGFRNRLVVLVNWAWAYLTFQRGGRLITGASLRSGPDRVGPS
jgi:NADH dehydrogenase